MLFFVIVCGEEVRPIIKNNIKHDLILLPPRSYMSNCCCCRWRWVYLFFGFPALCENLRERKFVKTWSILCCLGLGDNDFGLFENVLILWNIKTIKRLWYVHKRKFEKIWSLICALKIEITNVACAIGTNVNPLQNREIQHVNIVLQVRINFLNSQIWKEIMLKLNVSLHVSPHSQLNFPSKTWYFGIYLNFSSKNHLKIQP